MPLRGIQVVTNISARILLDSITDGGSRLVTWELTYPRMIHSEIMTHRQFSRNAASSRAIPASTLRRRTTSDPAVPASWGANQKGMQSSTEIADIAAAEDWWRRGLDLMAAHHEEGERLGLHKQIVNRVIEPWMMITIICSMTDHANFYSLRDHPAAEPNFQVLARMMREALSSHMPTYRAPGEWHLPMTDDLDPGETQMETIRKISVGRCARVSYLTHFGVRDLQEDVRLHDTLMATASGDQPGHFSPFEHQAVAVGNRERCANFTGWRQYRSILPHESGPDTSSSSCERCGLWGYRHVAGCTA